MNEAARVNRDMQSIASQEEIRTARLSDFNLDFSVVNSEGFKEDVRVVRQA